MDRFDIYIANKLGISRSEAKLLIKKKLISINGKPLCDNLPTPKKEDHIKIIDRLEFCDCQQKNLHLDLYSQGNIFCFFKPWASLCHSIGTQRFNLENLIVKQNQWPTLTPGEYLCNRLDYCVGGIVYGSDHQTIRQKIRDMNRSQCVFKEYYAIVQGSLEKKVTISSPILYKNNLEKSLVGHGQEAITHIEPLYSRNNISLIKCIPVTGRQHQIRAHLNSIGFPILGDWKYDKTQKPITIELIHGFLLNNFNICLFQIDEIKYLLNPRSPLMIGLMSAGVNIEGMFTYCLEDKIKNDFYRFFEHNLE